jgi:hypothetical protein
MPKGPKGEKRPADVLSAAVMIAKIATGEIVETTNPLRGQSGGKKGGKARAEKLTPQRKREIAKAGARARWNKSD